MRKLIKSSKNIDEAYNSVSRGLHNPQRHFFKNNIDVLKNCFRDYDTKALSGQLASLTPIWTDADVGTYSREINGITTDVCYKHNEVAFKLYGSSRLYITELWQELELLNSTTGSQKEEIICPICELTYCKHMDHHAPRAVSMFPEYSSHYSNLIPLCEECNELKSDNWVYEDNGVIKRIWFNPYFDTLPDFDFFITDIIIEMDMPMSIININPVLNRSIDIHNIILCTIDKLNLLKRYQDALNIELKSFNEREIQSYYLNKTRYLDEEDFYQSMSDRVRELIEIGKRQTIIEIMLYKSILRSCIYKDWIINELKKY